MGGPEMAPQTPQRSERPGKPGALSILSKRLEAHVCILSLLR